MIKYKATYRFGSRSPFAWRLYSPTITAEIEENVPFEEVERMARVTGEEQGWELDRVEEVS